MEETSHCNLVGQLAAIPLYDDNSLSHCWWQWCVGVPAALHALCTDLWRSNSASPGSRHETAICSFVVIEYVLGCAACRLVVAVLPGEPIDTLSYRSLSLLRWVLSGVSGSL
jgi:hypothetical protein